MINTMNNIPSLMMRNKFCFPEPKMKIVNTFPYVMKSKMTLDSVPGYIELLYVSQLKQHRYVSRGGKCFPTRDNCLGFVASIKHAMRATYVYTVYNQANLY